MDGIITEIKARLKIEEIVAQTFTITGRGRVLATKEHDSLKLWPATGRWWWFSQNLGGDVIDWHRHVHRCDLATAIEALAHQAGVERRPPTPEEVQQRHVEQNRRAVFGLAANWFARQLQSPVGAAARDYCTGRGWTMETVQREQIGYNPPSHNNALADDGAPPLANELRQAGLLDSPAAQAVLTLPGDMIVYAHRDHGATVYLSARSIEGKRHWNLPAELAGEKTPYHNTRRTGQGGPVVSFLVEGQADAIALGQLGVTATAICGVNGLEGVGAFSHIALDADAAGKERAVAIALPVDCNLPVVVWPSPAKDAADFLRNGGDLVGLRKLLEHCQPAILHAAAATRALKGDERKAAIRRLLDAYASLDEITGTDLKPELARACGIGIGQFNRLLAARKKEAEADGEERSERVEFTCGLAKGGWVFEQCVWWANGMPLTNFAVRSPEGKIDIRRSVTIGDTCYLPYSANTGVIEQTVVLFPARPQEYGSVGDLVEEIRRFINRYLDIDPFYERLAAYYVLFTWLYDVFENVPYMRALGDYGTGKTRFLQVIGAGCYRPIMVSGATTVSPIFRLLHMFRGTLVIDEADFSSSDAEAEIIKILNVGYYRGGVVLRSERDPASDEYFPSVNQVFGPKLLATRKLFADRATESRCLTKRMTTRRPRPGIPYTLAGPFWAEATALRNKLLMYRLRNWRQIEVPQTLADESVEPRLNQITMALKTLIDDTTMREQIDLFIRAYNDQLIGERQLTLPAVVLQAVCSIFWANKTNLLGEDERDLSMKGIADAAGQILADVDSETKITPRRVSQVLSEELGLVRRRNHGRTKRSMLLCDEAELVALMARYGISDPRESDR